MLSILLLAATTSAMQDGDEVRAARLLEAMNSPDLLAIMQQLQLMEGQVTGLQHPASDAIQENNRKAEREHPSTLPDAGRQKEDLCLMVRINGVAVPAIVDTGAQTTIMSHAMAKAVGLEPLIDTRFQGTAGGIGGFSKKLGCVASADLVVRGTARDSSEPKDFTLGTSINILEGDQPFLLGLDTMRFYDCGLNLRRHGGQKPNSMKFEKQVGREKQIFNVPFMSNEEADALKDEWTGRFEEANLREVFERSMMQN